MADGGVLQTEGNALLKAVFQGKLRLTRLLLEGGAYINEGNERGETPIAAACLASYDDPQTRRRMVRYLLEKGADPNIPDKSGRTALMHACAERAGREVVALLLENGADPSLKDYGGASALVHALNTGERESLQALLDACKARGQEVIIITSDTSPSGTKKTRQYLNSPPSPSVVEKPAPSCMSPSEVEIATASPADEGVFSFPLSSVLPRPAAERRPPPPKLLKRLNSEPWGLAAPLAARREEEVGGLSRAIAEVNGLSIAERPQLSRRHSIETPDPTSCCKDEAPPGQLLYRRNTAPEAQDPRPGPSDTRLAPQSIPGSPDSGRASAELRRFNASPLSLIASASRESLDGIPAAMSPAAARQRPAGLLERRGSGTLLLDHIAHSRLGFLPPLSLNPHRPIPDIRANGRPASPAHKVLVPVAPASPKRGPESKVKKKLMRRHSMQTEQMKQLSTFQEILAESGAD